MARMSASATLSKPSGRGSEMAMEEELSDVPATIAIVFHLLLGFWGWCKYIKGWGGDFLAFPGWVSQRLFTRSSFVGTLEVEEIIDVDYRNDSETFVRVKLRLYGEVTFSISKKAYDYQCKKIIESMYPSDSPNGDRIPWLYYFPLFRVKRIPELKVRHHLTPEGKVSCG